MIVATLRIELFIPGTQSLKEKRFVLKSVKTRIRNQFNVSVAEIGYLDKWQRSELGIAAVSNETKMIDSMFTKILNQVDRDERVEVLDSLVEFC